MSSPTAVGIYSQPVRLLAELVSESTAFRGRVGGTVGWTRAQGISNLLDSTGAAKKIHIPIVDAYEYLTATNALLLGSTLAIVYGENGSSSMEFTGVRHFLRQQGAITLLLFSQPVAPYDTEDEASYFDCANFFGGVIEQIEALAALDDRLTIRGREDLQQCSPPSVLEKIGAKANWWMNATRWQWGG